MKWVTTHRLKALRATMNRKAAEARDAAAKAAANNQLGDALACDLAAKQWTEASELVQKEIDRA